LERSKEQLNEILLFKQNSFKKSKIQITPKICEDKKGYEFYTNDFSNKDLIEHISLRIGEYIHNLRSTLDNLIFGFASMQVDPPIKPNKLSFPIFTDESQFNSRTKDIFNQIPEILKDEITKYQPFYVSNKFDTDVNFYTLSIVHTLNNIDKHRVPVVMVANINEIKFNGNIEFDNEDFTKIIDEENGFFKFFPIVPNSKIFEFKTLEKIEKMQMDFSVTLDLAIDYPNKKLNLNILVSLYNDITHIIKSLISVLEKKAK
jgi:hypothetical protein